MTSRPHPFLTPSHRLLDKPSLIRNCRLISSQCGDKKPAKQRQCTNSLCCVGKRRVPMLRQQPTKGGGGAGGSTRYCRRPGGNCYYCQVRGSNRPNITQQGGWESGGVVAAHSLRWRFMCSPKSFHAPRTSVTELHHDIISRDQVFIIGPGSSRNTVGDLRARCLENAGLRQELPNGPILVLLLLHDWYLQLGSSDTGLKHSSRE